MIHLVLREPIAYQRTLCRALDEHYHGEFLAWFASGSDDDFTLSDNFQRQFLNETGFATLFSRLRHDAEPVLVLGGWSSSLAYKTLLLTNALRVPTLIWADHPHPRQRSWLFGTLRSSYLRLLSHRIKAFLACGMPTVDHLASLGILREKIFNFPYWVSVPDDWSSPARVREENSSERPLRLLAIGRLVPMKGFDVAISAVARANQLAGRTIAELVVIGDGPERSNLERLAESTGIEGEIKFTGSLENAEVFTRLRDADALVVPSRFEPYGVVVLEALAHGRPVLASDQVIAALDKTDDSGAIRFHRAGEIDELAAQINLLADDRSGLREASHAARRIAELWKPKKGAELFQAILSDRLGRKPRSADLGPPTPYHPNRQPTNAS